jgi:hypothetical protein
MASELVSIGTDGNTEPPIDSTRTLNATAADQVTLMILTIDDESKQNSIFSFTTFDRAHHPYYGAPVRATVMDKES